MDTLLKKHDRLWERTSLEIVRQWAHSINWDARLMAIRGPKGVGKTTMMRQYIKQHYAIMKPIKIFKIYLFLSSL